MSKNKTTKQKQSWKPLIRLMKFSKFPLYLFLINIVIGLVKTQVFKTLPKVEGQILAGEIFDNWTIAKYVLATVAQTVVNVLVGFFSAYMFAQGKRSLQAGVWRKLIHMPMSEVDKVPPTTLVSRVMNDTGSVTTGVELLLGLPEMIVGLVTFLMMVYGMSAQVTKMLLVVVPFVIIACLPAYFSHDAFRDRATKLAEYTSYLGERLGSLEHIKAFAAEGKERQRNRDMAYAYFRQHVRVLTLNVIFRPVSELINDVITIITVVYGGYLMSIGELGAAEALGIFQYGTILFVYISALPTVLLSLKGIQGNSRTVSDMVGVPAEVMEREKSFAIPDSSLRLENVSFDYGNGVKVLDGLDLEIPQGKVTAIVGPSGSGKSTVLKLLERLYTPTGGTIWFGQDKAESIHLNEWREAFGMVPQDSPLLFGTIRENITYGLDEDVAPEELSDAIVAASVDEILERMPNGIDTEVGDVGDRLSGGERQRIALARMMIRDPDFLLLDEATSALDAENEYKVTASLNKIMHDRTTVVVAHNLRTIENADNIVFMENGKVVDQGTHQELLRSNARYQRYVELQHA